MATTRSLQDLYLSFYGGKVPQAKNLTHVVATVISSGDTIIYTPTTGKIVVLWWIYCINDPDEASNPLIKVKLGGVEKYRVYALSKTQKVVGPVDGTLVINLDSTGNVAVTALVEEVTEDDV